MNREPNYMIVAVGDDDLMVSVTCHDLEAAFPKLDEALSRVLRDLLTVVDGRKQVVGIQDPLADE